MFARASDIPEFVCDGVNVMGITGVDLVKEVNLQLNFSRFKFWTNKISPSFSGRFRY